MRTKNYWRDGRLIYRDETGQGLPDRFKIQVPERPSAFVMAGEMARSIGQVIIHGSKKVSDEERSRRLAICRVCEYHIPDAKNSDAEGACSKCGCYLKWKTLLEAWHCPIQKW